MKGVTVRKVSPAKEGDPRGRTWEWAKGVETRQITIYERTAGTGDFGAHFHKGEDPSKNPERFFLAAGKIRAVFEDLDGGREEVVIEVGNEIAIAPRILHTLTALEDVILIERRVTVFDKEHPDTYPATEFRAA